MRITFTALTLAVATALASPAGAVLAQQASAAPAASPALPVTPEERLAAAEARIAELEAENARLAALLTTWGDLYDPMEADRQLLLELRKELPDDEAAAGAYIERIRDLAVRSDPVKLTQPATRLTEAAPAWLAWRFAEYTDEAERLDAYRNGGALGFDRELLELRDEVLLVVASHLDAVLTIADRAR